MIRAILSCLILASCTHCPEDNTYVIGINNYDQCNGVAEEIR